MVGLLLDVGRGRRRPEEVRDVLEGRDRSKAGEMAAGEGLFLVGVKHRWDDAAPRKEKLVSGKAEGGQQGPTKLA